MTGKLPLPARDDVVLFGSFFSLADGIHEKLDAVLDSARKNNALILYDPNFRTPHLNELPKVMSRILENISLAGIVRGSDEDFLNIFATREPLEAYDRIRTRANQVLILTRSDKDVSIMTMKQMIVVPVPKIEPVSTIGAGDAFNAGLIHAFIGMGIGNEQNPFLPAAGWEKIAGNAIRFAQNVCMRIDNYISHDLLISPEK